MKNFHHMGNGAFVSDSKVNGWLLQGCVRVWNEGNHHWKISSGDTAVMFFRWQSSTDFVVANSSGYSMVTFYEDEYDKLRDYKQVDEFLVFSYSRPMFLTTNVKGE